MPKKNPLIKEILLGKTVQEVCAELSEKYNFMGEAADKLEDIIKTLVKANKPNVVFYAEEKDYNSIYPINLCEWEIQLDYWDYQDNLWLEEEAYNDCEILNKIVEDLFGKRKPYKVTKDQKFLLKKKGFACPCCGGKGIHLSDRSCWSPRPGNKNSDRGIVTHEIGCKECGYIWENKYIVTLENVDNFRI
jgi:transcription elongation factor Elf1